MKNLTKEQCEKKVIDIIKEFRSDKTFVPDMKTLFTDSRIGDSLTCVEITMQCEEDFNMCVPEEDCEKWKTLGDVAQFAFEHQNTCSMFSK